jgi:hypothetical protein
MTEAQLNLDAQKARAQMYLDLFSSNLGEKVLEDMKKFLYYNHSTHFPGDPHETAFREGMRTALLRIMRLMEIARTPGLDLTIEKNGTDEQKG